MKFVPKELPEEVADNSAGKSGWKEWAKNIAFVAAFLLVGWIALGFIADATVGFISDEQEAAWFKDLKPGEASSNDPAFQRAQKIFAKLRDQEGLRALPYELYLIKSPEPNAFALPGGAVLVSTGLLKMVESERSLALVLGHELGHHQHRHALKRMGRALIYRVALAAVFGGSGIEGTMEASVKVGEASFSRDQERESDVFGMKLVHAAYGRVDGSLEFFEKMQANELKIDSKLNLFASHPLTSERLKELRKLEQEYAK